MIKKIIFLKRSPVLDRDYTRLGIETLEKNGFDVEVWYYAQYKNEKKGIIKTTNNLSKYCKFFSNIDESAEEIKKLDENCFIITLIDYSFQAYKLYVLISKNKKIKYAIMVNNPTPQVTRKKMLGSILKTGIKLTKLEDMIFSRIPITVFGIRSAELILLGGSNSLVVKRKLENGDTKKVWIHAADYDAYLSELAKKESNMEEFAVFLDTYVPFHLDNKLLGLATPSQPDVYYRKMNEFFDFIEKITNTEIIIAAHPKSDYENSNVKYFGKRRIYKNRTMELVKKSKFVMCHVSTSANFAVLFKKPILFITTSEINNSWQKGNIETMAWELGKTPIEIEKITENELYEQMKIDENRYQGYIDKYIKKKGTEELPFWEVFSKYINENY